MSLFLPKLYPITDVKISGLSHREQLERLAAGGATLVQLRDKISAARAFYETALEAMAIARKLGVRVIVNDRVDIAMAVQADGVHLGQDDLPPEYARSLMGDFKTIGLSTHNLEQVVEASLKAVDYIAVGPVFSTSSKQNPDPEVGLGLIREVRARTSKPIVAIGGITLDRARAVLAAGADSLAVISDLVGAKDITQRVREFIREMQ
ncbi:MAG TPA: thiamine phosphate synthase [Blastocatellia bacterium]|nr:thiamine phosphate synthase [Blastocatellia bacterium]